MRQIKKYFIVFFIGVLFLFVNCSEKSEDKVYQVGILGGLDYLSPTIDGFKEKMAELGYVEGTNIIYYIMQTNFDPENEEIFLEKLVSDKVDLIFTFPSEVSILAKSATKGTDIPVLFANAFIEGYDLVNNIQKPGGNITGVRYPGPDIAVKSLEILLEIAPDARRIWLPYLDGNPTVPSQLNALRKAAGIFGIQLIEFPVASAEEIQTELDRRSRLTDPGIDGIMHIAEPVATWVDVADMISKFVTEYKLPYHGTLGKCVFVLTVNPFDVGRLSALLGDKILKGIPAGSIPVVSADPVLTINYNVASELDLIVPKSLLVRADNIIR